MKKIVSLQNPLVKRLVNLRKNKADRREQHSIVIEGKKLVNEVCAFVEAKNILFTDSKHLSEGLKSKEYTEVSEEVIRKISGAKSPEGIIAEIPYPEPSNLNNMKFLVACDGVSDPGNLGTILRTALALGWEGVYILDNCCDPFNDKALRAAKGSTFRLSLRFGGWEDLDKIIETNKLLPFCADIEGESIEKFSSTNSMLLVLGNESTGLSQETLKRCKKVTIPMSGDMESLNVSVAGGILMYLLRK